MRKELFIPFIALCIGGTAVEVTVSKIKIKTKGAHAFTPSAKLIFDFSVSAISIEYSLFVSFLNIFIAAIIHSMEHIEPIISGSSGPSHHAAANHGITKDSDAISVIRNTPFNAFIPLPQITTIKNGERNVKIACISATFAESAPSSTPETVPNVVVGTPTEPNAVGVLFTTRHAVTARMGSSPIPASIEAGIATAVPNPAIPSMKFPNPQPIISINILLSSEIPASIFLIESIAPVLSVRLYVKRAAIITKQIGHNAFKTPSNAAVDVWTIFNFQYVTANTTVMINAMPHAL